MWRIERNLLIPAVAVLLMTGLLVPAEAAPPKPVVWTITQGSTTSGKVVTLKAVIPVDPKDAPFWFYVSPDLGNCTTTGCVSSTPNGEAFLGYIYAGQPVETATRTGWWTVTGEYSKSGLTITIKLDPLFFPSTPPEAEQYIDVSLHALYGSGDIFYVESKIQQAFWWATPPAAPDSNQK